MSINGQAAEAVRLEPELLGADVDDDAGVVVGHDGDVVAPDGDGVLVEERRVARGGKVGPLGRDVDRRGVVVGHDERLVAVGPVRLDEDAVVEAVGVAAAVALEVGEAGGRLPVGRGELGAGTGPGVEDVGLRELVREGVGEVVEVDVLVAPEVLDERGGHPDDRHVVDAADRSGAVAAAEAGAAAVARLGDDDVDRRDDRRDRVLRRVDRPRQGGVVLVRVQGSGGLAGHGVEDGHEGAGGGAGQAAVHVRVVAVREFAVAAVLREGAEVVGAGERGDVLGDLVLVAADLAASKAGVPVAAPEDQVHRGVGQARTLVGGVDALGAELRVEVDQDRRHLTRFEGFEAQLDPAPCVWPTGGCGSLRRNS